MNDFSSKKLGNYYIDRKSCFRFQYDSFRSLDENGVLLKKIPYAENWEYYPVDIALYALGNFEIFLESKKEIFKQNFLTQANWLKDNITIKQDFGVWKHHYPLPYYDFPSKPWVHGMAQGLSISVLLRAFQMMELNEFYTIAEKALHAYEKNIQEGGIRFKDKQGNIWFEEYAILPPTHILNGFIYAMFGIYDFYRVTMKDFSKKLWDEGIQTLLNNLDFYDIGYWSLYNLSQRYPATLYYHKLHIQQLEVMYTITNENIFKNYSIQWKGYLTSTIKRKRAAIHRFYNIIQRRGMIGSMVQYVNRKRWLKTRKKPGCNG